MTPAELSSYVTVTFLAGAPDDGSPVRRRLLEQWVEGYAFSTPIPTPSAGEVFVLRRGDGESVVFGFKVRQDWAEPGRTLITAISASLREGEGTCGSSAPGAGAPAAP